MKRRKEWLIDWSSFKIALFNEKIEECQMDDRNLICFLNASVSDQFHFDTDPDTAFF